ncbi:MAG: tetratricopeptide repeat protein [Bacteroidetes bacterium]|nr:tetratricopeptide repeat protein [Bacteroidota bacterium]MBU1116186.1 tetratricopeptide repeat protein [Bacteroidota bacterium]MBU1799860.1 tetratricopeptide repeat protein [Bacteroidota bacterium]
MNEANNLYQNKQYQEAIEKYNSILELNYESSVLYYNLGNAYFRSAQIGKAILNYERALKLDPNNEDLLYNLSIVRSRTTDRIKEVPKIFIVEWWEILISSLTTTMWQILVLVFYLVLISSITLYFVTKSGTTQRITVFTSLIGFSGAIFLSLILFANVQRETSTEFGIITTNTISAKQSPNESSDDVFVIHEGLKIDVQDEFSDWYKIKLSDGKVGWLPKNSMEII